jgi:cell division control protein 6
MGLFNNILKDEESLFTNETALDFDYLPKIIPYRENEQQYIATCIKPLFQKRNGKNLIITGKPGIGKTAAIRKIFEELEQETDNIIPIYINCWKKDSPHKIALEICNKLNYKFTQNKTTEELLKEITNILNKKESVFCFDEIDKLDDTSLLYTIIEDIYRKTILLITNYKEYLSKLDQRIKSRLTPENLEFKPYTHEETKGILKQRIKQAFVPNIFNQEAVDLITEKTSELEDIRTGLFLLREAGNIAESSAKKTITTEHAKKAIEKVKDFKDIPELTSDEKEILNLIKQNSGKSSKYIYELYDKKDLLSYRNFSRRLERLEKKELITKKEVYNGGRSSIIEFKS